MKPAKLKLFILTAVLTAVGACAQGRSTFSGLLSLPLGDLKDSGMASTGFGADLQFGVPIANSQVDWVSGVSFFMHTFDADGFREMLGAPSSVDVSGGQYFDIPVLTGIRFSTPAGTAARPYILAQGGLNILMERTITATAGTDKLTVSLDPAFGFAMAFSAGVILNERVNLQARFIRMPEVSASSTLEFGTEKIEGKGNVSVSVLQFMLGVAF
jgi:hypothetical protein